MFRFAHVNLIALDSAKLIAFYKDVFCCQSISETRDLSGEWLARMTGVPGAHIVGEHLLLPGYGEDHPTLEIFSYIPPLPAFAPSAVNAPGFQHIAFEVEDVPETLARVLKHGGSALGELVHADYADGRRAVFVYARDPEGNILELQSWTHPNS